MRGPGKYRLTDAQKFYRRIEPDADTGCWNWVGRIHPNGYGKFSPGGTWPLKAHRWAYEFNRGRIGDGLVIDHLCRNRRCVNTDHMDAVTPHENWRRGESPTAIHSRKTHCVHGHEFSESNTYLQGGQRRQCRTCNKAAVARLIAKKRERVA
jgi:hypothetical protein